MKPWLNVSEAAEYAELEPGHDLHGMRARRSCEARASAEDAPFEFGRHGSMPGWNDTRRTFKIAGASATRRTERRHEPAGDDDGTRSDADTARALTEREVAELLGLSVATLRAWRHRGKGPRFLRLGRSVRYLPSDVADFVRASAVDTTSVSSSDDDSELGELRAMSLWKRGRQYLDGLHRRRPSLPEASRHDESASGDAPRARARSKRLDTAGCPPTNKGRSGSRMRSTPT